MSLPALALLDPRSVAADLGIEVVAIDWGSWLVSSTADAVFYRWNELRSVRDARIWEGVAQCMLTRLGVSWTATQAQALAAWLRLPGAELH